MVMQMVWIVEWVQWYRTGPYGDDMDFETHTCEFADEAEALTFKQELLDGRRCDLYDMKVQESDIELFLK